MERQTDRHRDRKRQTERGIERYIKKRNRQSHRDRGKENKTMRTRKWETKKAKITTQLMKYTPSPSTIFPLPKTENGNRIQRSATSLPPPPPSPTPPSSTPPFNPPKPIKKNTHNIKNKVNNTRNRRLETVFPFLTWHVMSATANTGLSIGFHLIWLPPDSRPVCLFGL